MENFICNCGKKFDKYKSYIVHGRFCSLYEKGKYSNKQNVKEIFNKKYYKDDKYICECGKEFDNYLSLCAHFSHCNLHHELNNIKSYKRPHEIKYIMSGWEKFNEDDLKEIRMKSSKTYSEKVKSGEIKIHQSNKPHTIEEKEKIRNGTLKYLESIVGQIRCRYSKKGCEYIDNLNKLYGWNLQHAENGGEVRIGNFWVDGYDKELNIVFEYDEKKHYKDVYNNILSDKDLERQTIIIQKTGCIFYRYNEVLDLFYKVN